MLVVASESDRSSKPPMGMAELAFEPDVWASINRVLVLLAAATGVAVVA